MLNAVKHLGLVSHATRLFAALRVTRNTEAATERCGDGVQQPKGRNARGCTLCRCGRSVCVGCANPATRGRHLGLEPATNCRWVLFFRLPPQSGKPATGVPIRYKLPDQNCWIKTFL